MTSITSTSPLLSPSQACDSSESPQLYNYHREKGASFTTSSIPLWSKSSSGCPLGFVFTPMRKHEQLSPTRDAAEEDGMNVCLKCLSYYNPYCPHDKETGLWTCVICQHPNNVWSSPLQHPLSTPSSAENCIQSEYWQTAAGCTSKSEREDVITIMMVLDGNLPPTEVQSILAHFSPLIIDEGKRENAKKKTNYRVGLVVYTSIIHVYQVGMKNDYCNSPSSADLYSPHTNTKNENKYDVDKLQGRNIEERMYIGSWENVVKSANAHFGLSSSSSFKEEGIPLSDDTNKGNEKQKPLSRKEILKLRREHHVNNREKGEAISNSKSNDNLILDALMGGSASIRDNKRLSSLPPCAPRNKRRQQQQFRCTGEAMAYAIQIASNVQSKTGRIFLFTNGCTNIGSGSMVMNGGASLTSTKSITTKATNPHQMRKAAKYFRQLGTEAFQKGIGIDVLCSGSSSVFGTSALLHLTNPSGGYVLTHSSFGQSHHTDPQSQKGGEGGVNSNSELFRSNITFLMKETSMSRAIPTKHQDDSDEDDDDIVVRPGNRMANQNEMNTLNGCIVDLRMPSFITPPHITGPVKLQIIDGNHHTIANERSILRKCSAHATNHSNVKTINLSTDILNSTTRRIQIGRYDPTSTISAMFEVNTTDQKHGDQNECVYFQFIVRFLSPHNSSKLITRVLTHRLQVSRNPQNLLKTIDYDVLPVVLGREATSCVTTGLAINPDEVNRKKDFEVRTNLDTTVHEIVQANVKASNEIIDRTNYPELMDALQRLHHFRRGSLIGHDIQHSLDDRAILCDLYLRLPLRDSSTLMAPTVWNCTSSEGYANYVPPITLALWDNCLLAADTFDNIFLWSGKSSDHLRNMKTDCVHFLQKQSEFRFPAPQMYCFNEGDSTSRKFTHRLVPSHGQFNRDTGLHEEEANFPEFASLSKEVQESIHAKFRVYKSADPSFRDWFLSINSIDGNRSSLNSVIDPEDVI